jgi:hypothetical protein
MNTATNTAPLSQKPIVSHSSQAIDFKELRANDIILIDTQNTCYRFVLTCEKEMQGRLSEDPYGRTFIQAVLIGSMMKDGERLRTQISRLEPQSHALFFVQQGDKLLKVLTSLITSLGCIRVGEKQM